MTINEPLNHLYEGGKNMASTLKRFTISVSPSMDEDLNLLKNEQYSKSSHSDMIRDLIVRGLSVLEEEKDMRLPG